MLALGFIKIHTGHTRFIAGGGGALSALSVGRAQSLAPGFRRFAPAIRRHTPSWVRPGTGCCKIHPSAGRTRER
jgi:hypothetical protein